MYPKQGHRPGKPRTPNPPAELDAVIAGLDELLKQGRMKTVRRVGMTTTEDGQWAVFVTVPSTTQVPLAEVEASTHGFPIVYDTEPDKPIRALTR
jgi:hypothetical protein